MKRLILLFVVCLFCAYSPGAMAYEESHLAAARKLLELTELDKTYLKLVKENSESLVEKIEDKIEENGGDASEKEIREFLRTSYDPLVFGMEDEFNSELAKAYADVYTEAELNEVIGFLQSPVGQKFTKGVGGSVDVEKMAKKFGKRLKKEVLGSEQFAKGLKEFEEKVKP